MAKAKVAASVKDYPGPRLQAHSQTRYSWVLPGLTVFLFVVMIGAISIGSTMISGSDTLRIIAAKLGGYDEVPHIAPALVDIVWDLRVPRVILAATVGAGLALAGVIMGCKALRFGRWARWRMPNGSVCFGRYRL